MKKQFFLKSLLVIQALALLAYTVYTGSLNGWSFLDVVIQNVQGLNWNGQFTLDFSCYLMLTALWIMWRSKFSITSIIIGIIAMTSGIVVFAPYLLYLLVKEDGDLKRVLIGDR
jgi:hypothetical protein